MRQPLNVNNPRSGIMKLTAATLLAVLIAGKLTDTAPLHTPSHAMLTSPLFNTPFPPAPLFSGNILDRLFNPRLITHQRSTTSLVTGSNHGNGTEQSQPGHSDNADSVTSAVAVTTPQSTTPPWPIPFRINPKDIQNVTTATITVSGPGYGPTTIVVVVVVPVIVTTTDACRPGTAPTTTARDPTAPVQSVTVLVTVPFTTTTLPAVTVTGLRTITSVVAVSLAG
ncbi:hypothetical protein B0J18DRAFT_415517 [Chaetomium sp. MPI-SDFR-AT-0129]|nr:hypothetical protein B0J18DRAFT_415517 [Chaetomium sp. MPI-SDFR-AT-0129]